MSGHQYHRIITQDSTGTTIHAGDDYGDKNIYKITGGNVVFYGICNQQAPLVNDTLREIAETLQELEHRLETPNINADNNCQMVEDFGRAIQALNEFLICVKAESFGQVAMQQWQLQIREQVKTLHEAA